MDLPLVLAFCYVVAMVSRRGMEGSVACRATSVWLVEAIWRFIVRGTQCDAGGSDKGRASCYRCRQLAQNEFGVMAYGGQQVALTQLQSGWSVASWEYHWGCGVSMTGAAVALARDFFDR